MWHRTTCSIYGISLCQSSLLNPRGGKNRKRRYKISWLCGNEPSCDEEGEGWRPDWLLTQASNTIQPAKRATGERALCILRYSCPFRPSLDRSIFFRLFVVVDNDERSANIQSTRTILFSGRSRDNRERERHVFHRFAMLSRPLSPSHLCISCRLLHAPLLRALLFPFMYVQITVVDSNKFLILDTYFPFTRMAHEQNEIHVVYNPQKFHVYNPQKFHV